MVLFWTKEIVERKDGENWNVVIRRWISNTALPHIHLPGNFSSLFLLFLLFSVLVNVSLFALVGVSLYVPFSLTLHSYSAFRSFIYATYSLLIFIRSDISPLLLGVAAFSNSFAVWVLWFDIYSLLTYLSPTLSLSHSLSFAHILSTFSISNFLETIGGFSLGVSMNKVLLHLLPENMIDRRRTFHHVSVWGQFSCRLVRTDSGMVLSFCEGFIKRMHSRGLKSAVLWMGSSASSFRPTVSLFSLFCLCLFCIRFLRDAKQWRVDFSLSRNE